MLHLGNIVRTGKHFGLNIIVVSEVVLLAPSFESGSGWIVSARWLLIDPSLFSSKLREIRNCGDMVGMDSQSRGLSILPRRIGLLIREPVVISPEIDVA